MFYYLQYISVRDNNKPTPKTDCAQVRIFQSVFYNCNTNSNKRCMFHDFCADISFNNSRFILGFNYLGSLNFSRISQ